MLNNSELGQRHYVIKQSGLDDAKILVENYKHLFYTADNSSDREQFDSLRIKARMRVHDLMEVAGQ